MAPRLANIVTSPGSIALAVAKLRTEAEADGETPTARAPLRVALHGEEPCRRAPYEPADGCGK